MGAKRKSTETQTTGVRVRNQMAPFKVGGGQKSTISASLPPPEPHGVGQELSPPFCAPRGAPSSAAPGGTVQAHWDTQDRDGSL